MSMQKHSISLLIGLLSLTGILGGVEKLSNQKDATPTVVESNIETDDDVQDLQTESIEETDGNLNLEEIINSDSNDASKNPNIEIVETESESKTETKEVKVKENKESELIVNETVPATRQNKSKENVQAPKETQSQEDEIVSTKEDVQESKETPLQEDEITSTKVDKVIEVNSNKELENLYNELNICDDNTIYRKVIINGKQYNNSDANDILNDLINTYGFNLNKLQGGKEPTETRQPVTEAPKETESVKTEVPKETLPVETELPQSSNSSYAIEVLRLVNQERAKVGLSALTTESKLTSAANKRAEEIVSRFAHTRPNGSSWQTVLGEFGVSPQTAGENIAYGQRTPGEVVTAWMNSEGHRANILNGRFGKLGVGVHEENGLIYWIQLFIN